MRLLVVETRATVSNSRAASANAVRALRDSSPRFRVQVSQILSRSEGVCSFRYVNSLLCNRQVGHYANSSPRRISPYFRYFRGVIFHYRFNDRVRAYFLFCPFRPLRTFYAGSFRSAQFNAEFPSSYTRRLSTFIYSSSNHFRCLLFYLDTAQANSCGEALQICAKWRS